MVLEEAYCEPPTRLSQTGFDDFRQQISNPALTQRRIAGHSVAGHCARKTGHGASGDSFGQSFRQPSHIGLEFDPGPKARD